MSANTLRNFAVSLIAIVGLSLCVRAQENAQTHPDDKDLMSLINRMVEAQTRFDAETLEKIYAADYIEVSPVGEVDVREKAIGFYKKPKEAASPAVTTDEFSIRRYSNFAIVLVRLSFTPPGSDAAARPPLRLRATVVCRREGKIWKIVSTQTTGIRIRPATP